MVAAQPERPALNTRRPFTRDDAIRAHVPPKILRTSRFRRIFRGVYVEAVVPDSVELRAEAALRIHPPTAFASHATAAEVWRLPVPNDPLVHVTVGRPGDRRYRPEIRNHVRTGPAMVRTLTTLRVSHPFQTFVELASMLSFVDLVVVGDAIVKVLGCEPRFLLDHCRASSDPHAATALRAAGYVRAEVDSPMETRLRLLIVLAGLPEPKVNHKIRDDFGNVLRRLDLSYPELKLIVEYDGRQHVERKKNWESDIDRREEFDDDGWRIVIVLAKGIYKEPERTLERVRSALIARGARVPARFSEDWRAHFPAWRR